jgi:cell division protein FtsI/penicillin-binding protein 2
MAKNRHIRRLLLIALLMGGCFALLGYRLVDLQVLRHDELTEKAQRNTQRAYIREPVRGSIRDSRGHLLAATVPARKICADPVFIGNRQREVAEALAPLLETNVAYLVERMTPGTIDVNGQTVPIRHRVLKKKVPVETWEEIQKVMRNLSFDVDEKTLASKERNDLRALRTRGIFTEPDRIRIYPNQTLAAHVIGYVNFEELGMNGIERAFNSKLNGIPGWRNTERDRRGREIVAYRRQDVEPRDGMNVALTIDIGLQHIVEAELVEAMRKHPSISISAIIVRPRTGEVLAMATLPTYDPNKPGAFPDENRRNRAITDLAEPGSTFKIVVAAAALNEELMNLNTMIDCEHGRFRFGGETLHDAGSRGHGLLSMEKVIAKSSNIGSAKMGIQLGQHRLHQYIRNFGFGERTGLPLPGEVNGYVPGVKSWYKVSLAQIPMGHGISVTPLQMAMAMSAIANDGVLMRPMLVHRLEDAEGNLVAEFSPQEVRRVVSSKAAREMVAALKTAVSAEGTGSRARLENYTVAGKTGTAQKVINGRYSRQHYFSSFIGFFPADQPELCISVVLDDPKNGYYGGQTAAPIFKNIADRAAHYMNLRPENLPDVPGPANWTTASPASGNERTN